MRAVQKVVLNGRSAQVTIIRGILFELDLRPGDLVDVWTTDDGVMHVRPFKSRDAAARMHPAIEPPAAPAVTR